MKTIEEVKKIIRYEIRNANFAESDAQDGAIREGCRMYGVACKKCLSLLEEVDANKEKPKKVIVKETSDGINLAHIHVHCPSCNEVLDDNGTCYPYCPHCGQKLDWEEETKNED